MPSCPRCGFLVAADAAECPLCRSSLAEAAGPRGPGPTVAWEDAALGFPGNIATTVRDSLARPAAFFARVPWEGSLARPLLYLLLVTVASSFFTLLWSATGVQRTGLEDLGGLGEINAESLVLLNFLVSPFAALLFLALSTLVLHLFVLMLAPSRRKMGATARALCYSAGPWLLTVVPWVGALAGSVWSVVLLVFGVREAHRTTGGRAAAAVLIPFVLLFLLVAVLAVLAAFLAERLERLPGGAIPLP